MRHSIALAVAFTLLSLCSRTNAGSVVSVDSWSVGVTASGPVGTVFDFSSMPENPFDSPRFASLGQTSASATHDFWWDSSAASFQVSTTLQAQAENGGLNFAAATGTIFLTPAVDLRFTYAGHFDYDLPPVFMIALMTASLRDMSEPAPFWVFSEQRLSDDGETASGTIAGSTEQMLLAGRQYRLRYNFSIDAFPDTMPLIGHGVGEAHFSLTPLVAEPASIGLLLAAVPLVLRRRRRCHS